MLDTLEVPEAEVREGKDRKQITMGSVSAGHLAQRKESEVSLGRLSLGECNKQDTAHMCEVSSSLRGGTEEPKGQVGLISVTSATSKKHI